MKTLDQLKPHKPAEKQLLIHCNLGTTAQFGTIRPTSKTTDNEIRAEFLHSLILNDDTNYQIDPKGIRFEFAWISGKVDLQGIETKLGFYFNRSVFEEGITLYDANIRNLNLAGSLLKKGMKADRMRCSGSLVFRKGFVSEATIQLTGSRIEGSLICYDGKFLNPNKISLNCERIIVGGSIFINNGFLSNGTVDFRNAKIGNDLDCSGGTFQNAGGMALNIDSVTVGGSIFFEKSTIIIGEINLGGTYIDSLVDCADFWLQQSIEGIYLDGFVYTHLYNDIGAKFRLQWLSRMADKDLKPQPWKQLAKVLKSMGYSDDSNYIMIALHNETQKIKKQNIALLTREKFTDKCSFINLYNSYTEYWKSLFYLKASYIFKMLYSLTSRYGYRPMRTLSIMFVTWFMFGLLYWYSANVAVFAPSNPLVFQNEKHLCKISSAGTSIDASLADYNASNNWYHASPGEYTTFQPFWYSLDIILPVVDLQMEKDWGVYISSPNGTLSDLSIYPVTLNHITRWVVWFENILGWILSLILVAILSGLAKNDKD